MWMLITGLITFKTRKPTVFLDDEMFVAQTGSGAATSTRTAVELTIQTIAKLRSLRTE